MIFFNLVTEIVIYERKDLKAGQILYNEIQSNMNESLPERKRYFFYRPQKDRILSYNSIIKIKSNICTCVRRPIK